MSARARAWAQEHAGAGSRSRIEGKTYRLLRAIAHDADDAGVVEDLTVPKLMQRIHASRRKVYYALARLQKLGALQVDTPPGKASVYRVLQPSVRGAQGGAQGGAKPQVAEVVEASYTGALCAPPHIEEACSTDPPSTTTTLEPVPPGELELDAAGGGGSSLREDPTGPRPVPYAPPPAGDHPPTPLEPVLERLSPAAAEALEAIVDLCREDPAANPLLALLAATAYERASSPAASPEQVSAAITRQATAAAGRVERPRPHAAPASPSHGRFRTPGPRPTAGRRRRDPHVRPAVPPPAPAGPIPRGELERIALELAAHHGVPDPLAPDVAAQAAHVAWLKAAQGSCGNLLLYVDGVVKRRAREAQQQAERAAAAATAPPRCRHGNDPAGCGACDQRPAAGPIPAQRQAELDALKRSIRLPGRSPPAAAS